MRIENSDFTLRYYIVETAQKGVHLRLDPIDKLEFDNQINVLCFVFVCH